MRAALSPSRILVSSPKDPVGQRSDEARAPCDYNFFRLESLLLVEFGLCVSDYADLNHEILLDMIGTGSTPARVFFESLEIVAARGFDWHATTWVDNI